MRLLDQFYKMRKDNEAEKKKVGVCCQCVITQENTINELRQFIEENLIVFLEVVSRERAGITKTYKPVNE